MPAYDEFDDKCRPYGCAKFLSLGSQEASKKEVASTELHRLVRAGDEEGVRKLLSSRRSLIQDSINERDEAKMPPLFYAVQLQPPNVEIVRLLLEAGAKPNVDVKLMIGYSMSTAEAALTHADLAGIKLLVEKGLDIASQSRGGYSAAHHACSRVVQGDDPDLIPLLDFLLNQGIDFDVRSNFGEVPVRMLASNHRIDAIRFLLERGVSGDPLEWTALHWAVALGTLEQLRKAMEKSGDLEAPDTWNCTPFALAAGMGSVEKADLLLAHGANIDAENNFKQTPLGVAAGKGDLSMLRWLIARGADLHHNGGMLAKTPVMAAIEGNQLEAVKLLVEAGAIVDGSDGHSIDALNEVNSPEMGRWLLDAGADPRELRVAGQRVLIGLDDNAGWLDRVWPHDFQQGRSRRFGQTNPEVVKEPFWLAMIHDGVNAYAARQKFGVEGGSCGQADPVWCADRFGQSITFLPDGRVVQIAGEHEDGYDPDFGIYNDVFVHEPNGEITIFVYPEKVFPPTDFHTANLVGDHIYIVGNVGYPEQRRVGFTQVCRLDTRHFVMEPLETTGESPGWLSRHRALVAGEDLVVFGGDVWNGKKLKFNEHVFRLNLKTLVWCKSSEPAPYRQWPEKGLVGLAFDTIKAIFS